MLLRRTERLADGWFPLGRPDEQMQQAIERLHRYVREAGRDPGTCGIQAQVNARDGDPDAWMRQAQQWRDLGATHVAINTMGAGLASLQEHFETIRRYREAVKN